MQYDGRNLERTFRFPSNNLNTDDGPFRATTLSSNIPSTFSFGAAYVANINEDNQVLLNAVFSNFNEASDQVFGGIEYGFKNFFFLRGGYNYEAQIDTDDQLFGAALGAGIRYPVGSFEFMFDYAWRDLTDYFDANNIFTIKLAF
ncbi:MAG: hypothetical protein GWN61_16900 [candidate division Zixibacteria bacterium]|nr:hypothetical protein [candidate division Zixibacteria bacterium]NIV07800.1 hypothetical protein [candidate division Zixibacteria bacterium]NIW47026.1 hypothetical protein [Gammaproteobacteria bacterium]